MNINKGISINHQPIAYQLKSVINIDNIDKIYLGQGDCCRCGCGGNYAETDNRTLIERRFKRFLKHYAEGYGRKVKSIDNYIFEINVSETGLPDKVLTIYLKEPN